MIRIGNAMDIHQLVEGRKLILGGVEIEHTKGCLGHSDADVLLHAVAESILGALALGDLGKHFPDTADSTKDMDSMIILKEVVKLMKEKGFHVVNIDSTINIEKPKMAPHILKMRENIANACECDLDYVSVKATRGEKMGFVGCEEGVLAIASVLVEKE